MNKAFTLQINNLCDRLYSHAQQDGQNIAISFRASSYTFKELVNYVNKYRMAIRAQNLKRTDRVLVMIPMSPELVFLLFALFSDGIVPVLVDPRLQRKHWKRIFSQIDLKAIFAVKEFYILRWLWPSLWTYKLFSFSHNLWGVHTLKIKSIDEPQEVIATRQSALDETLLLTLTSGTTGNPKIVERKFTTLLAQQNASIQHLPFVAAEKHLALYPVSVLQSIIGGAHTYYINSQSPQEIADFIVENKINRLSGPPGLIDELMSYLEATNQKLDSLLSLLTGGAPIPKWYIKKMQKLFPNAQPCIVYGSTECEPIAFHLITTQTAEQEVGYCVGKVIPEIDLVQLPYCEYRGHKIFEIQLHGQIVTDSPFTTGDLAYLNRFGQLVLVGRKNDSIDNIPSAFFEEPLENIPNSRRVAVIHKDNRIQCVYETFTQCRDIHVEIAITKHLENFNYVIDTPVFVHKIPVDPRHGWKIQRTDIKNILNSIKNSGQKYDNK